MPLRFSGSALRRAAARRGRLGGAGRAARAAGEPGGSGEEADLEAPAPPTHRLRAEALHAAAPPEGALSHEHINLSVGERSPPPVTRSLSNLEKRQVEEKEVKTKKEKRFDKEAPIREEYAKAEILKCKDARELVLKAPELIEDGWLFSSDDVGGNMYRVAALGTFSDTFRDDFSMRARVFGCVAVAVVQLLGAPAVFFERTFGYGTTRERYDFEQLTWENKFADWEELWLTKLLGVIFLGMFILNGLFAVREEQTTWLKIFETFQYLQRENPAFQLFDFFLYAGAFINCWTVLWCCISSFVVIGGAANPQDVLMDALGMLFLYNLDDIGGDLGFVGADAWLGKRIGWIHREMCKKEYPMKDALGNQRQSSTAVAVATSALALREEPPALRAPQQQQQAARPTLRKSKGWIDLSSCFKGCGMAGPPAAVQGGGSRVDDAFSTDVSNPDMGGNMVGGRMTYGNMCHLCERRKKIIERMYAGTAMALRLLAWLFPLMAVFTPFSLIVPDF